MNKQKLIKKKENKNKRTKKKTRELRNENSQ